MFRKIQSWRLKSFVYCFTLYVLSADVAAYGNQMFNTLPEGLRYNYDKFRKMYDKNEVNDRIPESFSGIRTPVIRKYLRNLDSAPWLAGATAGSIANEKDTAVQSKENRFKETKAVDEKGTQSEVVVTQGSGKESTNHPTVTVVAATSTPGEPKEESVVIPTHYKSTKTNNSTEIHLVHDINSIKGNHQSSLLDEEHTRAAQIVPNGTFGKIKTNKVKETVEKESAAKEPKTEKEARDEAFQGTEKTDKTPRQETVEETEKETKEEGQPEQAKKTGNETKTKEEKETKEEKGQPEKAKSNEETIQSIKNKIKGAAVDLTEKQANAEKQIQALKEAMQDFNKSKGELRAKHVILEETKGKFLEAEKEYNEQKVSTTNFNPEETAMKARKAIREKQNTEAKLTNLEIDLILSESSNENKAEREEADINGVPTPANLTGEPSTSTSGGRLIEDGDGCKAGHKWCPGGCRPVGTPCTSPEESPDFRPKDSNPGNSTGNLIDIFK